MQGARSLRPHNGPDIVRRHWLIDQGNWSRIARQFLERVWPAALISQGEQQARQVGFALGRPISLTVCGFFATRWFGRAELTRVILVGGLDAKRSQSTTRGNSYE